MENKSLKYKAFISYSHQDQKFAKWLHKKIENYKIPKSLPEKYPNLPKDLKRTIFIDDEELPTASALPDNLSNALESSELLIVICSPSASKSYWVDKEIAYYKQHHGEGKVLAVLNDGEPNASYSSVYDSNLEAFPKSLRYKIDKNGDLTDERTEPLAADARKLSGRKKALIKLIAGILKVDFADLWEREKREVRKRRVILGSILALFIALSIYAFVQFLGEQGNKELEQINTRIATIEYTIRHGELPQETVISLNNELKKLKVDKENKEASQEALGKLKTTLGKKAQKVYQKEGAKPAIKILTSKEALANQESRLKDISKEKLALAKLYVEAYEFEKAEENYKKATELFFDYENVIEFGKYLCVQNRHQQALGLYERLLQGKLSNLYRASILFESAEIQKDFNQLKKALELYTKSLVIAEALAKDKLKLYNRDAALTTSRMGSIYSSLKEDKKAVELQEKALIMYKKIKDYDEVGYKEGMVDTLNELFRVYGNHDTEKAKFYLIEAIKTLKSFKDQSSLRIQFATANLVNNLGLSTKNNRYDLESLFQALEIYKNIAKINPEAYEPNVAKQLRTIANAYENINDIKNAEKYYMKAELRQKKLYAINPKLFSDGYLTTLENIGDFYTESKQYEKAKDIYVKTLRISKKLTINHTDHYSGSIASIHRKLGDLFKKIGQLEKTKSHYLEAIEYYKQLNKEYSSLYKEETALAYSSLGRIYMDEEQWNTAWVLFSEELQINKELAAIAPDRHNVGLAFSYNALGKVYENLDKFEEAKEVYRKSIAVSKEPASDPNSEKNKATIALWLMVLSNLYKATNDFENSEAVLNESLNIYRALAIKNPVKYELDIADTLSSAGLMYLTFQKVEKAENPFLEALAIYRRHTNKNGDIANILSQLTAIYLYTKNIDKAKHMRLEALSVYKDLMEKSPEEESHSLMYASSLLTFLPISNTQQNDFDISVAIFQKYRNNPIAAAALIKLAPYMEGKQIK